MALITHRLEDHILYLEMHGRIDASNALQAESELNECIHAHPGTAPVIDAERLEYLSSAGLRIVLRLKKEFSEIKIIGVNSELYEILEMTGFTDILTVEKAFRRLSLEGCEMIAAGANGRVYRYDPETIVKVYFNGASLDEIRTEKDLCRKVFIKGINTAIPYDIVRVDEYYGSVAELLNATSIAKLIRANPEKLDEYMDVYADLLKKIHEISVEPNEMPPAKAVCLKWVRSLEPHLPREQYDKLIAMAEALAEPMVMVHGDFHVNNVMIQNDEPMLIDMDTVCCGHPIFDFAAIYLGYIAFPELDHEEAEQFYNLPYEIIRKMWELVVYKYFDGDEDKIRDTKNKAMLIAYARLLRRTVSKDSGNTTQIELCKKRIAELLPVTDRLDY